MVLGSLHAALDLLRSPSAWLPGLALGIFAASSLLLLGSSGPFTAERLFVLEMVTFPFFIAGLYGMVKTNDRTYRSFTTSGISGYYRVLLPSVVLIFAISLTILLALIPLMIAGLAETVLPFTVVSVSITILFFTFFYDAAAILEGRKVLDCLRRSVEFVLTHARDCIIFYLVVIVISAAILFGIMILWTAALYDKISPLASYNATQMQAFTPDQFMAILGPDGMAVSAFFLFAGLAILVSVVLGFKACFYRDRSEASPPEVEQVIEGEYDSKGRWYKY
ncbi:MAG: hypothetical protein LUQ58_00650 [Methanomicrobiales archaeon]|nr:hypothetical protein [Methanomicrobiales archaeon]